MWCASNEKTRLILLFCGQTLVKQQPGVENAMATPPGPNGEEELP